MIETFYLNSRRSAPKLRIGVMIDDSKLIAPFAAVLKHIQQCDFAGVQLVIRKRPSQSELSRHRFVRLFQVLWDPKRRSAIVYGLYQRWDQARHSEYAKALAFEDCSALLKDIPEISVQPLGNGNVHRLPPEAINDIRDARLDVILRFGFNILKGDILNCARYGVWSYHHGDNDFYRGGPAGFWELVEREPLTGAVLQVLNDKLDAGLVLAKTLTPTKLGASRAANLVAPYRSAEPMIIEKLHQLHENDWDCVQRRALPQQEYRGRRKLYRKPTNSEMSKWIFNRGLPAVARRIMSLDRGVRQWTVGIRPASGIPPWKCSGSEFRWLEAPAGHFYADPFLFEREGRTWLFVEDYDMSEKKGNIACAEILHTGEIGPWKIALTGPHHLSFPLVFEQNGEVFMIPESRQSEHVALFRSIEFPWKWELDLVLLDKPGLDTSLHVSEDGTHYFFTSFRHSDGAHPHLYLFTTRSLREKWSLHPASPLSRDARYSRNAGAILEIDGLLVRPSQDGTLWYGLNSHFHGIEKLTPTEYRETLLGSRKQDLGPDAVGTHSYSRSTQWEAIDCLRQIN